MELHQLRCFIAIVEEGGFNRATTRLFITQPALSYQIKQLEEELGAPLFHRRARGISTTEAGRLLFQHAQELLEAERKAKQAVERLSHGVVGEIRIGTINSVGIYFLPKVFKALKEKYPMLRPVVMYRRHNEVIEALLSNQVDLAVVVAPRPDRRLTYETVITEKVSLVCGPEHPFFKRSSVKPAELRGMPFILLTPETTTGQLTRDYMARLGINVDTVVSTPNVDTVRKMVEVGLGAAFLPDMVSSESVSCDGKTIGNLARIPMRPPLTRRIVLVTWKEFEASQAICAFIDELRRHGMHWKGCVDPKNCV